MLKLGGRRGLPFLSGSARPPASPQQGGSRAAATAAAESEQSAPQRFTVLLIGPAGEGKSTLGNLLVLGRSPVAGAGEAEELPFDTSEEFDSVPVDIAHADFELQGSEYRVIDVSGMDGGAPDIAEKLASCAERAPGGIDAFVFVMQKGRFTSELASQLQALQDVAGPGSLARTVIVFTHCGMETTPQLLQRCRQSGNGRLREMVGRYPAVVGVDSLQSSRAAEDRAAVLEAAVAACQKAGEKSQPVAPADIRRELQEAESAIGQFSTERQDTMRAKLDGIRTGGTSLSELRQALEEARQQQRLEEHRRLDQAALCEDLAFAEDAASRIKAATQSMLERKIAGQDRRLTACCTPASACQDVCAPCEEGVKELTQPCNDGANDLIRGWREERRRNLEKRFSEADAIADLAMLNNPRCRESPMDMQRQILSR